MATAIDAQAFFEILYRDCKHGSLVLCSQGVRGFKRDGIYELYELPAAAKYCESHDDVYFKFNLFDATAMLRRDKLTGKQGIGLKSEVMEICVFAIDLDTDIKDPKYKSQATLIWILMNLMPVAPSLIIGSDGPGGGLHAYWILKVPILVRDMDHYNYIKTLARRWYALLAKHVAPQIIDATFGPERILRPVGSRRAKSGNRVVVLHGDKDCVRYELADLTLEAAPDEVIEAKHSERVVDFSVVDYYMDTVLGLTDIEDVLASVQWVDMGNNFWRRPDSTSGFPTGEVYLAKSGEKGITLKTPGMIQTQAISPIDGSFETYQHEGGKWYSPSRFWVMMTFGGVSAAHWKLATEYCLARLPVGWEFEPVELPPSPVLEPPVHRAGTVEQIARATRACEKVDGKNQLLRCAGICIEHGLNDLQTLQILQKINSLQMFGQASPVSVEEFREALKAAKKFSHRGCMAPTSRDVQSNIQPDLLAERILREYGWDYDDPNRVGLRYWREDWYRFRNGYYQLVSRSDIRARVTTECIKRCDEIAETISRLKAELDSWRGLLERESSLVEQAEFAVSNLKAHLAAGTNGVTQSVVDIAKQNLKNLQAKVAQAVTEVKRLGAVDKMKVPQCSPTMVTSVLEAMLAMTKIGDRHEAPIILHGSRSVVSKMTGLGSALDGIVFRNGVLNVRDDSFLPLDPRLFSLIGLNFEYTPGALCERWLKFLQEIFTDADGRVDHESIRCLQEWFGLNLVRDTSFQKIMHIIGPSRSGKSTLLEVLMGLLGENNIVTPKLSSLIRPTGMASLVGKSAAIITDSRVGGTMADREQMVEVLLGISGADTQTVARKYKDDIVTRIACRITIVANLVGMLPDSSGALAVRSLYVETRQSFKGREDRHLSRTLLGELPGIFNWALEGLRNLRAYGEFKQPSSAAHLIDQTRQLSDPLGQFFDEHCIITGSEQDYIEKDALFAAIKEWYETTGLKIPPSSIISRDIYATTENKVRPSRQRIGKRTETIDATGNPATVVESQRVRVFTGILPKLENVEKLVPSDSDTDLELLRHRISLFTDSHLL